MCTRAQVAIDGVRLAGKELRDVTDMLRGDAGTKVKVTLQRDGVGGELEAVITRKQVKLRDVPLSTFLGRPSEGVGYVRVQAFAMDTKQEVQNALAKLASLSPDKRLKAVVLDLRGNPGGLLSSAVGVAETFLPARTTIVETRGRVAEEASAAAVPTKLAARQSQPPAQPPGPLDSLAPPAAAREPDGADWRYTSTRPPLIDPSVRVVVLTDGRCALPWPSASVPPPPFLASRLALLLPALPLISCASSCVSVRVLMRGMASLCVSWRQVGLSSRDSGGGHPGWPRASLP